MRQILRARRQLIYEPRNAVEAAVQVSEYLLPYHQIIPDYV